MCLIIMNTVYDFKTSKKHYTTYYIYVGVGLCKNMDPSSSRVYREYYMVARKYEIYFECEQDISFNTSEISCSTEQPCDIVFIL